MAPFQDTKQNIVMKTLHVAIFTGEFPVLSETFVMRQISGLIDNRIEVTIIAGKEGDRSMTHDVFEKYQMRARIRVIRKSKTSLERSVHIGKLFLKALYSSKHQLALKVALCAARKRNFSTILDLAEQLSQEEAPFLGKFDAIIAHFGQNGVRAMNLRKAGVISGPISTIFHGFDMSNHSFLKKWMPSYRELFQKTEYLLPISNLWSDRLVAWGAQKDKIRVLRMGVDLESFPPIRESRPVGNPLKVLSVARLTEKKGIAYAIQGVKQSETPVHYRIIGAGPLESDLKALAALNPGSIHVIDFLGRKTHLEVFAELDEADVFLLPSITADDGDMEGIPVSIMEAMAKGVVVLATRHSGTPELVEDGKNGFLVSEKNSEEITKKLWEIVRAKESMASIRISARKKIESLFDNGKLDLALIAIIKSMASNTSTNG